MKRQTLLNSLLLTAFIATSGLAALKAVQADSMMKPSPSMEKMEPATSMQKMEQPIASGRFVASEHPTTGMATVVMIKGQNYLKFDRTFKSDDGPDLYVVLHRESTPKDYKKDNYVNLGRLQKVAGSQMYAIPDGTDLSTFKTAVIWCQRFSATFGFANLI